MHVGMGTLKAQVPKYTTSYRFAGGGAGLMTAAAQPYVIPTLAATLPRQSCWDISRLQWNAEWMFLVTQTVLSIYPYFVPALNNHIHIRMMFCGIPPSMRPFNQDVGFLLSCSSICLHVYMHMEVPLNYYFQNCGTS